MSTTCLVRQLQYIQYEVEPGKLGKYPQDFLLWMYRIYAVICGLRSVFCVGVPGNVTSPLFRYYIPSSTYTAAASSRGGSRRMLALGPLSGQVSSHLVLT